MAKAWGRKGPSTQLGQCGSFNVPQSRPTQHPGLQPTPLALLPAQVWEGPASGHSHPLLTLTSAHTGRGSLLPGVLTPCRLARGPTGALVRRAWAKNSLILAEKARKPFPEAPEPHLPGSCAVFKCKEAGIKFKKSS